jgi:hypothetical protein
MRRPSSFTSTPIRARETGLPAESTAFTVTSTEAPRGRYEIDGILRRSGRTWIADVAVNPPADAVTVAVPVWRNAVNVVAVPARGATLPKVDGASDHAAETGTVLPNESSPAAVSATVPRDRVLAELGATTTDATGPASTVTVCVPLVAPSADAVSNWLPARVSR